MQLSCSDRSYRPSLAWLSLLLVLPACAQAPISQVANAAMAEDRCSMSAQAPQRITLPDGSRIMVDVSSMAVQNDDILVLGSPFYVIGEPGQPLNTSAVGMVWSGAGQIALVPSPLPTRDVKEMQAVAAKDGGWHVIFVTGTRQTIAYDSADIWYAHYDGRGWTEAKRITRAYDAKLSPWFASNLVETGQGLAFALTFSRSAERRSKEVVNNGIVMLLQDRDEWTPDTLPTWRAPQSIQLTALDGKLRAIFSQSYFTNQRLHGPALFIADYDSTWQSPRLVYDPEPEYNPAGQYISTVMLPTSRAHARGVSWLIAGKGEFDGAQRLEWGVISDDGSVRPWSVAKSDDFLSVPATIDIDSYTTVWLVRDGDSRERLRVYAGTEVGIHDVGIVETPLMNFVTGAVPLKDGRIIAVTGGADNTAGAEPPFASYLTEITVRCAVDRG